MISCMILSLVPEAFRCVSTKVRAAFKIVAARLAVRGAFKIVAGSIEAKS